MLVFFLVRLDRVFARDSFFFIKNNSLYGLRRQDKTLIKKNADKIRQKKNLSCVFLQHGTNFYTVFFRKI